METWILFGNIHNLRIERAAKVTTKRVYFLDGKSLRYIVRGGGADFFPSFEEAHDAREAARAAYRQASGAALIAAKTAIRRSPGRRTDPDLFAHSSERTGEAVAS